MAKPDYRRPLEPLVSRNDFRERTMLRPTIPSFASARERLPEPILPAFPEWVELYWRAWEMAIAQMQRPALASGLLAPYVSAEAAAALEACETAFTTQYLVYGRRALPALHGLDNFYARQHDDGFICRAISAADGRDLYAPFNPDGSGPNVLAWSEWRTYRQTGDEARLSEVIWPLWAHHLWLRANRTWPDGLYWSTGVSSGMPDQPRLPGGRHHHQHWSWVDATLLAALDTGILGKMAAQLEIEESTAELARERLLLQDLLNNRLWNGEADFYQDRDRDSRFSATKSIAAYWALQDQGLITAKRLELFVQQLSDPERFKTAVRVPSMSVDSEGFAPQEGGWRGAVWPAATYMVLKGLQAIGQSRLAQTIARAQLDQVSAVFQRTDTFWDCYSALDRASADGAQPDAIAQTALTPIATLLEDVLGITCDWPLRRVIWRRYLETDHPYGVRNYPLGPEGTLDLIGDSERVLVNTDVPFTLHIRADGLDLQIPVGAGASEIDLA